VVPPPTRDSMEVDVSISGGVRWNKIATYYGSDLANNGNYGTEFVPSSATQWKARGILVPPTYRTANTFLRFHFFAGNAGNNVYLDHFSLYQYPADVKEAMATAVNSFNIFPNPANNGCKLLFKTGNDGVVSYAIKDLTGKVIFEANKTFPSNSVEQEAVPRSVTPAAGMYFVTITIDGMNATQKLVVY
jgi:hypothetical protein